MEGFEEEILDLENKMKARRQTDKGTRGLGNFKIYQRIKEVGMGI